MHRSRRPPPFPRPSPWPARRLWVSIAVSALLHAVALLLVGDLWRRSAETQAFRARLELPVRFQPRRLGAAAPHEMPRRELEYVRSEAGPRPLPEPGAALPDIPALDLAAAAAPLAPLEIGARADTLVLPGEEQRPSPVEYGWSDTLDWEEFELLRVEDLARADVDHAVVVEDPTSRRDLTGFANLTPLRLYGAGSGNVSLDALARYMRDHTSLLVQVRQRRYDYFESENLLKDPIHFLVQGGGFPTYRDDEITRFSPRERELMERYLRAGGFLFIEGGYRYLEEMRDLLRQLLGGEGRIYQLPATHPLYQAFFDFGGGFPGEERGSAADDLPPSWYYPAERRVDQPPSPPQPGNPDLAAAGTGGEPPLGLWGVALGDELVAVLSDLNLHAMWGRSYDPQAVGTDPTELSLQAGTNLLVYALTRPRSLATHRAPPAWVRRRPAEPAAEHPAAATDAAGEALPGLDAGAALRASLALVRSPLATELGRGGVRVRVDGRYTVEVLRATRHGLLLRGLAPGRSWVEVAYDDRQLGLSVDLVGGKVTTVTLGVSRLAVFTRLRAQALDDRLGPAEWFRRFDDLSIEEVFLDAGQDPGVPPPPP